MGFIELFRKGIRLWFVQNSWRGESAPTQFPITQSSSAIPTSQSFIETGIVHSHNFTLTRTVQNIDFLERDVILINGEFPGPLIEANFGDTISITVQNNISDPEEGTSMHWHGMLQTGSPWFDGVTGVTQCPIAPEASLTYTFLADQYGTSCNVNRARWNA